jgi:hypothetical protein
MSNNVQPNNSNVGYIYTTLIRYILLYYRHLDFKKFLGVGLLDCWTLCFENYLFKITVSLLCIFLKFRGVGGLEVIFINDRIEHYLKCQLYYKKNTPRPAELAEEYKAENTSN